MATHVEQQGLWSSALVVPNRFPVLECTTAAAWINLVADRERLGRERDESRAACHRLRYEVQELRAQLATGQAEMVRARETAERLKAFRGKCDRLYAAQAAMSREATR